MTERDALLQRMEREGLEPGARCTLCSEPIVARPHECNAELKADVARLVELFGPWLRIVMVAQGPFGIYGTPAEIDAILARLRERVKPARVDAGGCAPAVGAR